MLSFVYWERAGDITYFEDLHFLNPGKGGGAGGSTGYIEGGEARGSAGPEEGFVAEEGAAKVDEGGQ